MQNKILVLDTTLRDGEQGEGICFTVKDKLKILRLLDDLGVDYVEGGWPGSNPKAIEFFQCARQIKLKYAKLTAFGSTYRPGKKPQHDYNLQMLVKAGTPTVSIFGKTWDLHVHAALKISLEENLKIIKNSILFLKKYKKEVIFDAEHFFDGYKYNPQYALQALQAAVAGGADFLVLCDTNGGSIYSEIEKIVHAVKQQIKTPLGIHAHNDSDNAIANTLAAVRAGAVQVHGTINGYGERCGNANLCSVIPDLQIKMAKKVVTSAQLRKLTSIAHHVAEIANLTPNSRSPFVGYSAFTHKAGIHVSAVQKNSKTYEHIAPELVGNKRRVLVSEQSGMSNVLYKAREMNLKIDLKKNSDAIKELLKNIKIMEHAGYQFEEGEASFELLVKKAFGRYKPMFELISFHVSSEKNGQSTMIVEATVKIKIKDKIIHTVADGNGPVSALARALYKALAKDYPQINNITLTDYRVRVLDTTNGTQANVRVIIESSDGETTWGTVGVSTDIIEASWQALVDSIEYRINK